jgi:hypothetical protein
LLCLSVGLQHGYNGLHLSLKLVDSLEEPAKNNLVEFARELVQFSHCLLERDIDVNCTAVVCSIILNYPSYHASGLA